MAREEYNKLFQSTHSIQSATELQRVGRSVMLISIHALHTECDASEHSSPWIEDSNFNPRTPYRVRLKRELFIAAMSLFQSTHSIQSATDWKSTDKYVGTDFNPRTPYRVRRYTNGYPSDQVKISIHALHTECDHEGLIANLLFWDDFNPRTPYRVRLRKPL
ncbi:hypothetical protein PPSQR21_020910 [Paenibacillus polymyxa SQR-21]|nr:hypothetical protein PPSQR21_020910 [Paenibacillus polymyxa SQR-21]